MESTANKKSAKQIIGNIFSNSGPLIALIILFVLLTIGNKNFMTVQNFVNIAKQTAMAGFLALGMMVCILTAGIDLSIGYTMTLSSMLLAYSYKFLHLPSGICILIGIVSGILFGLINGLLLTKCKLPHPFISTMGTQNIYRGIALVMTGATPIAGMSATIRWAGLNFLSSNKSSPLSKIPVGFLLMVIAFIIFSIFLSRTKLGRHIYAVGGNITTARLSGINVDFVRTIVYVISGFMASLGGIILVGRTDSAYPLSGNLLENDAIAAVIIGGTSFFGGKGTVAGTFVGVILISVLRNGMNLLGFSADMQIIMIGVVIILAVLFDVIRSGAFKKVKRIKAE